MEELTEVKQKISVMAALALAMWRTTHQAFMEHNMELLSLVLEDEERLNRLEKDLTALLIGLGKDTSSRTDKALLTAYADVVGDLELIGDYCKDILERVQIKIEERLLFSDDAVKELEDLYRRTESALSQVSEMLAKDDMSLAAGILNGQRHIDTLVDEYRQRHTQRLLDGICSPLAGNMFLNILDFTAAVYYHTKKIARSLLKIKT